ncbi:hypothetical protein TNCV_3631941 [Trichonephila clavipes]|nr:hypothetical protein TNCV_3631941 [Trichonephila clavipes]
MGKLEVFHSHHYVKGDLSPTLQQHYFRSDPLGIRQRQQKIVVVGKDEDCVICQGEKQPVWSLYNNHDEQSTRDFE